MKITFYRYYIALGRLNEFEYNDVIEHKKTYSCYGGERRLKKENDGVACIHDRTSYPYIDFYSTENSSREFAIDKIIEFLTDKWGLR